ncbi:MAG TPA: PAS domain-containing protein, partial [Steroidobacteraceae bacterium]|nr:PAS domain-containing protein [Steroidobacteraceae bacterium]
MPTTGLLSLILALTAAVSLILCLWQWRRAQALAQALARAETPVSVPATPTPGNLFAQVGDAVHEAVVLYKEAILYANPQFARLAGVDRMDLVGRQLTDLVAAGQGELVTDHLARRLAGDESAGRFEVDLVSPQGQQSRLELTATPVNFEHSRALLLTGMDVIPTMSTSGMALGTGLFEALGTRSRARGVLESLGEALLTTDQAGRVDYANPAAVALLGVDPRQRPTRKAGGGRR